MSNNEVVKNINIEDMEPGVVYQVNNPDIEKLKKRVISQKRKIKKLTIYNRILILGIIAVLLFMSITLHHMNKEVEEVINSYNEIIEQYKNVDETNPIEYCGLTNLSVTNNTIPINQEPNTKEQPSEQPVEEIPEEIDEYPNIPLDKDLKNYIVAKCNDAGIPPEILFAMAWKESNYTPTAKSSTNDYGLLQINKCNFDNLANALNIDNICEDIYNPYINVDCSIYILKDILNNYTNTDWHQVLMRYNMGPGGAAKCFNQGKFSSEYSRAIIDYAQNVLGLTDITL